MYFQFRISLCLILWQCHVFCVVLKDLEESEICESEECHKTAQHILKWLNPEVDPCEDFYEFACGNWQNLPTEERTLMSLGARGDLVKKFIPVLLEDPSTTNGNKYFEKLRNFLITCLDEETIQSLGVTPIKELIQKAGGWPVLDSDWSEKDWDFLNAEITLGGVLIDVDATYHLLDNLSIVTYLIEIGPSSMIKTANYDTLGLGDKSTKAIYDKIVEVAVDLGANKQEAEKAMQEVLEFETAFVGELIKNNHKNVSTYQEFQKAVPWIDFEKLLDVYLPDSFELSPEENIIGHTGFFFVLDKFIKQYPPETFVNYLISKAVYQFMDYVETDDKEQSRFGYCTEIATYSSFGPILVAYLGIMYTDSSNKAVELATFIKEELVKEVENVGWLDDVTRVEAVKNTSEIKIYVGFPQNVTDLNNLDTLYEGFDMDTSNFFDAMLYDKQWARRREFDRLHMNFTKVEALFGLPEYDTVGWRYYTNNAMLTVAHFIPEENAIEVTGPMLYYTTLFSLDNPGYINYGHVGIYLAHELIHAVDINAKPIWENFLQIAKLKNNKTENIYNNKKQCFIDFYSSFNDTKYTQMKLNGEKTQREDIADNGGLKLSLGAYRKYANQLGSPERKLPRLTQYNAEQLFMISVANFFCMIPSRESRMMQIAYSNHSIFEYRVKGIMMNSPDFSEIFNCDKDDPMNPPDKCEVW